MNFKFKNSQIDCSKKTITMGIINVTPDSFSDGGKNFTLINALKTAKKMIAAGVDILDVGGESTRPSSTFISAEDEINRVIPFIRELRKISKIPVSIDTWKSEVAEAAIIAGADIINDISGFFRDERMKEVAAKTGAGCIVMHSRGTPQTMMNSEFLVYNNLINDIKDYFTNAIDNLQNVGVKQEQIMLDVGIGFSKSCEQNLELIKKLKEFKSFNLPILLATSRKNFIGLLTNERNPEKRDFGTAATISIGIINGANCIRIHNVKDLIATIKMSDELK